jgi:hypothetical protein
MVRKNAKEQKEKGNLTLQKNRVISKKNEFCLSYHHTSIIDTTKSL